MKSTEKLSFDHKLIIQIGVLMHEVHEGLKHRFNITCVMNKFMFSQ
jgi:galactokinase